MLAQSFSAPVISTIKALTIRLLPGEDLKASLDKYIKAYHIQAACIITCVGSLQQVAIRYANQTDVEITSSKFEIISLTGTLAESGSHLHIAVSDISGKMIGGHLKEGSIIYTTAEIVIGILTDLVYERKIDSTYGFRELDIKNVQDKNNVSGK